MKKTLPLLLVLLIGFSGCSKPEQKQPQADTPHLLDQPGGETAEQPSGPPPMVPRGALLNQPSAPPPQQQQQGGPVTLPDGLQYEDLVVGTGAVAETGHPVSVHYTGWLTNGQKFDSSLDHGQPFQFQLGGGEVIRGWDEGVAGMRVGGKRKLIVPPDLGYGDRGAAGAIPPGATLIFEVQLLGVS